MIASEVELDELLTTVGERVATAMDADRATVWLVDAATGALRSRVAVLPELEELVIPKGSGVVGHVVTSGQEVNIRDARADERWSPDVDVKTGYSTRSLVCTPILGRGGIVLGALQVLNKRGGPFTEADAAFLHMLAEHVARAFEYTSLHASAGASGFSIRGHFNHIIGSSPTMCEVYEHILRAAETSATVLLRGETGTGKGLFARAIHVNSKRQKGPLIAVDCTTLPSTLVESELFGHERGAYTGAERTVPGKVELADGGTLFLDELGELPLELQGKLLRFLQERKFERVGGRETLRADVRIVCATNRDLEAMVAAGTFRSDLYYRVRVLDIALPSLRSRGADDILSLAEHFLALYARRYDKAVAGLSQAAASALTTHVWPGNVRELEHAIERAVVLSRSETIEAADLGLRDAPAQPTTASGLTLPPGLTLAEVERRYAVFATEAQLGNQSATARQLKIGRNKLARLLKDT